jgi:hypothetical protein
MVAGQICSDTPKLPSNILDEQLTGLGGLFTAMNREWRNDLPRLSLDLSRG